MSYEIKYMDLVGDEDDVVIITAFIQEDVYNTIVANGYPYTNSTAQAIMEMLEEKYFPPVVRPISLQEIKERVK